MGAADFTLPTVAKPNPQESDMEIATQLSSTFYNLANLINMTEGRRLLDSALKDTAASMMKVLLLKLIN